MQYIIYEMIAPSLLEEVKKEYYYVQTIENYVLRKLDVPFVEAEHPTMESAIAEIDSKKDELKHLTLTILPIFKINYIGEIQ